MGSNYSTYEKDKIINIKSVRKPGGKIPGID
jgi:hypothetical protein